MAKELINLDKVQKEVNSVFERLNESFFGNYKRPAINISQNLSFIFINVELKGVDKEDILLKLNYNSLDISAERKKRSLKKGMEESSYRGYKASIGLPTHVNIDEMKAEFKNETLKITVPKMKTRIGTKIDIK